MKGGARRKKSKTIELEGYRWSLHRVCLLLPEEVFMITTIIVDPPSE